MMLNQILARVFDAYFWIFTHQNRRIFDVYQKPGFPESFAKHHDAYKKNECRLDFTVYILEIDPQKCYLAHSSYSKMFTN